MRGGENAPQSEVIMLQERLDKLGIDCNETSLVLAEAVLMFGDGRPEHEVEKIVNALFKKIDEAEEQADKEAA